MLITQQTDSPITFCPKDPIPQFGQCTPKNTPLLYLQTKQKHQIK